MEEELAALDPATVPGFRLNGLKREELIATNSMLLHEVYFDSLGEGGGGDPTGDLADAMARDFGSLARWRAEFVAMGKALGGGLQSQLSGRSRGNTYRSESVRLASPAAWMWLGFDVGLGPFADRL